MLMTLKKPKKMDQERHLKVHRLAERFWFAVFIVTTLITIYWWATDGIDQHRFAPVVPGIALLWFLVRRALRKKLERSQGKD